MEKDSAEMTAIVGNIYKKTIAYDLEKVVINEDRTTSHLHSDSFLDKHIIENCRNILNINILWKLDL